MIPYDELVVALTTWRARQGLPIGQMSGQLTPPEVPSPIAAQPSGGTGRPGSGPTSGPPSAPPARITDARAAMPPPLASPDTHDEPLEVEEHLLVEETHLGASAPSYEGETLLDSDLPADEAVESSAELASSRKPPAW